MNIKQFNQKNENLFLTFQNLIKEKKIKHFYKNESKNEFRAICPHCKGGAFTKNGKDKKKNFPFRVSEKMAYCHKCKMYFDPFELAFQYSNFKDKSSFLKFLTEQEKKQIPNIKKNFIKLNFKKYEKITKK